MKSKRITIEVTEAQATGLRNYCEWNLHERKRISDKDLTAAHQICLAVLGGYALPQKKKARRK